jgi:pantothenate kinase
MPDPPALHARRGAHWTFNGERFVKELKQARATGAGRFPSFDHHVGDPVEDDIEVSEETCSVDVAWLIDRTHESTHVA